tara:strand:- start:1101 stop:1475 length:375 start_codon:yes stop_codon:yes gene_type:complete
MDIELKKQKKREAHKRWRDKNKEFTNQKNKTYYNLNKEYFKDYYAKNPQVKVKSQWKQNGIICDYDAIYEIYRDTNCCDHCNKKFGHFCKVLDHCHTCGTVRGVICRSPCNNRDLVKCHNCDLH